MLGRWPFAVFGVGETPLLRETCPLCKTSGVDIAHLLTSGCGIADLRASFYPELGLVDASPRAISWDSVRMSLFCGRLSQSGDDVGIAQARIRFVGECAYRAACAWSAPPAEDAIDHLISAACQAVSVDVDEFDAA